MVNESQDGSIVGTSPEPAEESPKANTHKHRDDFLKKLFAEGEYCKELFRKLCKEGCSDEDLASLLFVVCTISVGDRKGLIDLGRISMPQVRRLAKDLRSLAELVDRVNKTSLNPKLDLLAAPTDANRDPTTKVGDSPLRYASRHYESVFIPFGAILQVQSHAP